MKKMTSYIKKLDTKKILLHIALIALTLLALAIVAFFVMRIGTRHSARSVVPNLTGISITQAKEIVSQNDLNIIINDSLYVPMYDGGIVLDQLPEMGVEVKPGRTIYVTINSFLQKEVQIPYVAERSLRQAKNMLEIAGLEIAEIIYRPDMATNYVLEASYNGESITRTNILKAKIGSGITLYVGVGSQITSTRAPLLIAQSLKEAKSRIWEAGLNVGEIDYDDGINLQNKNRARVYSQSPVQNRNMRFGARVNIKLTLDAEKTEKARLEVEELARWIAKERMRQDSVKQSITDSLKRVDPNITEENQNISVEELLETENNDNFFD